MTPNVESPGLSMSGSTAEAIPKKKQHSESVAYFRQQREIYTDGA